MQPQYLTAVMFAALAPALAAEPVADTGKAAFDRRDFRAAAELWSGEAAAGSADARFGLGLLSDLGLGTPRDSAKAMRWYMEAAADGLAEAEFNVGVMLDAGTGVPQDHVAAAVWYSRAAANGHPRGEYNLGILYETGEGVPRNPDLARYWFSRAAETLPAAAERLAKLRPASAGERGLVAPDLAAAVLVPAGNARSAELSWSAPPGAVDARYQVELARLPRGTETWGSLILDEPTEGSALVTPVPAGHGQYAWRVSSVDRGTSSYAASPWQSLGAEATAGRPPVSPAGRVSLHVGAADIPAQWLARELAVSFSDAGLWVRVETEQSPARTTTVRYAFVQDVGLAASVAEFLPVLNADDTALSPDLEAAPGEVNVWLVGGPSKPEAEPNAGVTVSEAQN